MRPGTKAPTLEVPTLENKNWNLESSKPQKFTMVVFYRGLHCPVCKVYLQDLSKHMNEFKEQGVTDIIAISGDSKEKAMEAKEKWNLTDVNIGHGLNTEAMKNWGLFISKAIKDDEPEYFSEPGLFLIDNDHKLFYCSTSSMPFARPKFKHLLKGLEHINKNNYPRRGTVQYEEIN